MINPIIINPSETDYKSKARRKHWCQEQSNSKESLWRRAARVWNKVRLQPQRYNPSLYCTVLIWHRYDYSLTSEHKEPIRGEIRDAFIVCLFVDVCDPPESDVLSCMTSLPLRFTFLMQLLSLKKDLKYKLYSFEHNNTIRYKTAHLMLWVCI